jgi:hypothetical protein
MFLIGVVAWSKGQLSNTIQNYKVSLHNKCLTLIQADNGLKTKFSNQFKAALEKIIPECYKPSDFTLTDFSGMSNQETLFLKHALYILGKSIDTDVDPKLIFEVRINAFDDLTGILPNKSCKSGQDRTLTQIAFQETLASYNFKLPETDQEKAEFAARFFANSAMQATLVIEFARGEGGKIKWEIGKLAEQPIPKLMLDWFNGDKKSATACFKGYKGELAEQPIPKLMFDWLKDDKDTLSKAFINFYGSDSDELTNENRVWLNKGLKSLNLEKLTIVDDSFQMMVIRLMKVTIVVSPVTVVM